MFLWHVNGTGISKKIGITIGNGAAVGGPSLRITAKRQQGQETSGANYLTLGKCIAKALLGATLDTVTPVDALVTPQHVGLIEEFTWPNGALQGGEWEITIQQEGNPTGPVSYRLRTVFGPTTADLRQYQGTPLPSSDPHVRGGWDDSEIQLTYVFGIPPGQAYTSGIKLADASANPPSPDFLLTKSTSYDSTNATDNKANFGAIYQNIQLQIDNGRETAARTVSIYLGGRGGAFTGAVSSSLLGSSVSGIPTLSVNSDVVSLGQVSVPAGRGQNVTVRVAVGGASSTPFALYLDSPYP
ncbi:MAG: hypothetical protein C4342_07510 [Armatimonadota bacterium]